LRKEEFQSPAGKMKEEFQAVAVCPRGAWWRPYRVANLFPCHFPKGRIQLRVLRKMELVIQSKSKEEVRAIRWIRTWLHLPLQAQRKRLRALLWKTGGEGPNPSNDPMLPAFGITRMPRTILREGR